MSASGHIYLVIDAVGPVAAFTARLWMTPYLIRRLDAVTNMVVYTFGDGHTPSIMIDMSVVPTRSFRLSYALLVQF